MKQFFFLLFCCLVVSTVSAQEIEGVVFDELKRPVSGALVYLDGTSIGVVTSDDGLFRIVSPDYMYATLVINANGFLQRSIVDPFSKQFHTIIMVRQGTVLREVIVKAKKSRFKRTDRLKVFKEQFLGRTTAGNSCIIINESKIRLDYNLKKNQLFVSSEEPIKIHNEFLGYDIEYTIKECYIEFSRTTINSSEVIAWSFVGTVFFKDLTTESTTYRVKRQMSYEASQMQFFRNLCRKSFGKDNFQLFHGSRLCDPEKYFRVKDFGSYYFVTLLQNKNGDSKSFYHSFILEYPGKEDSEVVFSTQTFKVDKFGNNSASNDVIFFGALSTKRVGDMLPLDYKTN